ncbi:MAG: methionine biosynthesis protein MetW [Planctomycetia bacterium]
MPQNSRYPVPDHSVRHTDELIMQHIDRGSRVIDLGCGDGRLMQRLNHELGCDVLGIEVEHQNIVSVIRRGLPAIEADLNEGLKDIPDGSFDFAVLSQTLQQVRNPRKLLMEMLRVAKRGLVVVPNFGHWRVRLEVLRRGRTPVTEALPWEWYETPNVHFMSMRDFRDLMERLGLRVVKDSPIIRGRAVDRLLASNLRADSAFYLLERDPKKETPELGNSGVSAARA